MTAFPAAPWHRASYDRFLLERLPALLAERLPLGGYHVEPVAPYLCRVHVTLATDDGEVGAIYEAVPQPDDAGIFEVDGARLVVTPTASCDELDLAEIRCAGEQHYDYIEARLGHAPAGITWDEAQLRAWLPLEEWTRDFLRAASPLETTNLLATHTHLRRLRLPEHPRVFTRGHFGRTCPIETPEGPNIGRILVIARGAEICDGKLIVVDDRPEAALGLSASMIPFLENSDPCRLLMGANMLRQWLPLPDPEPALVQTGNEPDDPAFWCGRNVLTAYVSGGWLTFEDGIVISESCARRLGGASPAEPGDKMSNRHGNKGVVSRVLPDDRMPHLEDGTPVELVFTPMSLYSRLTFGQLREAVASRVARHEGRPIVVPPFHAPSAEELRRRIVAAGLPESGMCTLRDGKNGREMPFPSAVGWVYWGRLHHTARRYLQATVTPENGQPQGEPEYQALRLAGAFETAHEQFQTRACEQADAGTLAARVAEGAVAQAGPPSARFVDLQRRLAVAGIQARLDGDRVTFAPAASHLPAGAGDLALALPVPHPWLPERMLTHVEPFPESPHYERLIETNARLARIVAHQGPQSLREKALADVEVGLRALFGDLLPPETLQFEAYVTFSGRAVTAPGGDLHHDQVGLPDEIAWTLFGPRLIRETGESDAVAARTADAAAALDVLMARSWVLISRLSTLTPTGVLAFHPVRIPDAVIRLHPFAGPFMEADFDGDQLAVFLPITEEGQQEAGEKLTLAAHIRRDPSLVRHARPIHDARFGLAYLALTADGRAEIERLAGTPVPFGESVQVWKWTQALAETLLQRDGAGPMLDAMERLARRGFEVAGATGASVEPFPSLRVDPPARPTDDDPDAWSVYFEEYKERLIADYASRDLLRDATALTLASASRGGYLLFGGYPLWLKVIGLVGVVPDLDGGRFPIKHGYAEGLTAQEVMVNCIGVREGMARSVEQYLAIPGELSTGEDVGYGVLARALRARKPGIVFARAAAAGSVDPLDRPRWRLFVGLPTRE